LGNGVFDRKHRLQENAGSMLTVQAHSPLHPKTESLSDRTILLEIHSPKAEKDLQCCSVLSRFCFIAAPTA
jgi:hypothetical protein